MLLFTHMQQDPICNTHLPPKKSELVDSVNAPFLYTSKQIDAVKPHHKKLLAC